MKLNEAWFASRGVPHFWVGGELERRTRQLRISPTIGAIVSGSMASIALFTTPRTTAHWIGIIVALALGIASFFAAAPGGIRMGLARPFVRNPAGKWAHQPGTPITPRAVALFIPCGRAVADRRTSPRHCLWRAATDDVLRRGVFRFTNQHR